ncbi:hypothetical protein RND71_026519 [Anisodus tanguticus]|uniref:Uncharacterized protein n=1 Tax=Anisodus tanguticus TaxID=243964 RepID=A0AAE1VBC9_9SOLA|nr:hypothetical protein RND71_026519 [Anisodus tanguticus]
MGRFGLGLGDWSVGPGYGGPKWGFVLGEMAAAFYQMLLCCDELLLFLFKDKTYTTLWDNKTRAPKQRKASLWASPSEQMVSAFNVFCQSNLRSSSLGPSWYVMAQITQFYKSYVEDPLALGFITKRVSST